MSTVVVPIPDPRNQTPLNISPRESAEPPPDGGLLAWTQVGATFAINAFTWGQTAVGDIVLFHICIANVF
jgi:hypothetical protein